MWVWSWVLLYNFIPLLPSQPPVCLLPCHKTGGIFLLNWFGIPIVKWVIYLTKHIKETSIVLLLYWWCSNMSIIVQLCHCRLYTTKFNPALWLSFWVLFLEVHIDGLLKNIVVESENKWSTTPPQSFLIVQISAFYFLIK